MCGYSSISTLDYTSPPHLPMPPQHEAHTTTALHPCHLAHMCHHCTYYSLLSTLPYLFAMLSRHKKIPQQKNGFSNSFNLSLPPWLKSNGWIIRSNPISEPSTKFEFLFRNQYKKRRKQQKFWVQKAAPGYRWPKNRPQPCGLLIIRGVVVKRTRRPKHNTQRNMNIEPTYYDGNVR